MVSVLPALGSHQLIGWYFSVCNRQFIGPSLHWRWWFVYFPSKTYCRLKCSSSYFVSLRLTFSILSVFSSSLLVHVTRIMFRPDDIDLELLQSRKEKQANSDLLVTWSRSTSASSIYRCVCLWFFLLSFLHICILWQNKRIFDTNY